jgi:outer membrane protein TolC
MIVKLILVLLFKIAFVVISVSQTDSEVFFPDSLTTLDGLYNSGNLSYDSYMDFVRESSLMSIVANNTLVIAKSERDAAGGIYDPYLYGDFLNKNYKEKNYFNIGKAQLSQFTPFGLSINAGIEHNTGEFVNPENTVPLGGLGYLGVELQLLNGLFTDERRTKLKMAENSVSGAEFDRDRRFNELGEQASSAYWLWWRSKESLLILDTAIKSAIFRLKSVRRAYEVGYKPAIDTLDAQNQVLFWKNEFAGAYSDFVVSKNNALLYASDDRDLLNESPTGGIVNDYAQSNSPLMDPSLVNSVAGNNPEVRLADYKIQSLEIERDLKQQKLLPKLNAKYNVLAEEFNFGNESDRVDNLFTESIKWGLKLEYPILATEARNELQVNQLKIESTQAERDFKQESVKRKINTYLNQIQALRNQISNYEISVENYDKLVQMERRRYEAGDGSLFLINYREFKLYESKIKLVDYRSKIMLKLSSLANTLGYFKITQIQSN